MTTMWFGKHLVLSQSSYSSRRLASRIRRALLMSNNATYSLKYKHKISNVHVMCSQSLQLNFPCYLVWQNY